MIGRAVVFPSPNKVEFREISCPDPGDGDVVVEVTHSWISNGTERSFLRGERTSGDTPFRPGNPDPFPIVPGYQKVGRVISVGPDVADIEEGETVFATVGLVDGMYSLTGRPTGGHVSPSVCRRDQIWKLPSRSDALAFSGLVLTQVGYNCGTRAPVGVGEGAVVIGDGLVGHWAAQTLIWRGADVVLVGHHDDRLRHFEDQYAGSTVNAAVNARAPGKKPTWTDVVRERLPRGVHIGVDTAGSVEAVEQLLPCLNRDAHTVSAGFYGTRDRLPLQPLRRGEISLNMVSGWQKARMNETLSLIVRGFLSTLPLITHHFPVSRAAEAWELIASKDDSVLGVILDWEAGV